MKRKYICLTALALVLVASVWSTGIRLAFGQAEYSAPDLELWEGQASYDLLAGIEYDDKKYALSIQDLGGFDINALGIYTVGYVLTPTSVESSMGSSADLKNPNKSSTIGGDRSDVESEASVYSNVKDVALVWTDSSASIFFTRRVMVKEALTYTDQRLDLGMTDLLSGFVNYVEGYSVVVVDNGDFDPNIINEYQVTYALYNPSGIKLRQFQRYIQVTRPGVEFYAPELAAEGDLNDRDWIEDVDFDRTRYTITLLTQPDLEATKPQRLLYRLDEIVSVGVEVSLAEEAKIDLTQSDSVEDPDAHLAAIFGREVTLLRAGDMAEKLIVFNAPDLVITVEELENMDYIDLLKGVTAVDENGEVVQVQVFDRSQLDQAGLPPTEPEQEAPASFEAPDMLKEPVESEELVEPEVPLESEAPIPSKEPDMPEEPIESEELTEPEAPLESEAPVPSEAPSVSQSPIISQKPGESPIVFQNPGESPIVFENSETSVEVMENSEFEESVVVESATDPAPGIEQLEVGVA